MHRHRADPATPAEVSWSRRSVLAASIVLLAPSRLRAASLNWAERRDFDNRVEGRLNVPYGSAGLELASFTRGDVAFKPAAAVELYVRFFLPADAPPVQLIAHELNPTTFYWMEAKQRRWTADRWNRFGPWQTEPVLARLALDGSLIGVLVWLGDPANRRLAPATVEASSAADPGGADYVVQLRSGRSIAEYGWTLASRADPGFRHRGGGGDHVEGEPFPIRLPTAGLPPGDMRLTVSARWRWSPGGATEEYRFFHPHGA
jgi:hypothetical protein